MALALWVRSGRRLGDFVCEEDDDPQASTCESTEKAGAWPLVRCDVAWVEDLATIERLAPTSDARGQAVSYPYKCADLRIEPRSPCLGEGLPLFLRGCPVQRQSREALGDLSQRQTHILGGSYERDPAEHVTCVAPLPARGP